MCFVNQSPVFAETETGKPKLSALPLKALKPVEDMDGIEDIDKLFEQAQTKYQSGKLLEAKEIFTKIVAVQPENADAYFNLGAIAEWQGNLPEAAKYYNKAHALKPNDLEIKYACETVLQGKQNKSEASSVYSARAKKAFASGNYSQAIMDLSNLVRLYPSDGKIYFALSQSLRAIKSFDWAIYCLKMAIYLDPSVDIYKTALQDLEAEIKKVQEKACIDAAQVAIIKMKPFVFSEVAESGI